LRLCTMVAGERCSSFISIPQGVDKWFRLGAGMRVIGL
jgi:hypothetical protein